MTGCLAHRSRPLVVFILVRAGYWDYIGCGVSGFGHVWTTRLDF